jgi:hypothetical protein
LVGITAVFVSVIPSARAALLSGASFGQVLNTVGIAAVMASTQIHLHSIVAKLQAYKYFFCHSRLHALLSPYFTSYSFLPTFQQTLLQVWSASCLHAMVSFNQSFNKG